MNTAQLLRGRWMTAPWEATCHGTYLRPRMDEVVYGKILDPLRDLLNEATRLLVAKADQS